MTFLNLSILFGLIAVSIPIVIHLFNRRKANVVEWGAMRFLLGSLVNRRKRIQVEELILMGIRCLLISLIVLAVARPFTPVGSSLAWLALLPIVFLCVLTMALATILTRSRARRILVYAVSTAVVLLAVHFSRKQQLLHGDRWKNASSQDVAIIVDGSNSMRVLVDGQSNFERAVDEARKLTESLGPDDHVTILVAGGLVESVTPEPVNTRSNLDTVFDSMQPVGGTLSVTDALSAAAAALNAGDQAGKKIVLITDGQKLGWSEDNPGQWEFLADTFARLPTSPPVVSRFLPLPDHFQNGAVTTIEVSRKIVGTDRPATIRVSVENTGFEAIEPSGLQLTLDQTEVLVSEVGTIESGKTLQLNFEHQFKRSGPHTIEARLMIDDDLPEDDRQVQLLHVLDTLPVLLVDGSGGFGDSHSAASYVELALAPPADEEESAATLPETGLVKTTLIAAPDLSESVRFENYRVVMLLDVPRLGTGVSAALSRYVEQGGGLLIVPGNNCEPDFYNSWKSADGRPIVPSHLARLIEIGEGERSTHPVLDSFTHPALSQLVSASQTDLSKAVVSNYWQLESHPTLSGVRVGGVLDGGDPFLVEQPVVNGLVACSAVSFDQKGSNLPSLFGFLPFLHELTYHLASPTLIDLNRNATSVLSVSLPQLKLGEDTEKLISADVTLPDGNTRKATFKQDSQRTSLELTRAVQPGIHRVELPEELAVQLAGLTMYDEGKSYLPFAILNDAGESRLAPMTAEQEVPANRYLNYFHSENFEQLVAAVIGDVPGFELWKFLALGAVLLVLAESFVTRWIAQRRKLGTTEAVSFVSEGEKLSTFQQRAKELLESVRTK